MTPPDTISNGPVFHFALTNPHAETEREVAAILRQTADAIEALGDVEVLDITFLSEPADDMDYLLRVVVYYAKPGMHRLQPVRGVPAGG